MNNLIRAEIFKLRRNKAFWAIFAAIAGLSTLMHLLIITDWWYMSGTVFDEAGMSELNALSVYIVPLFFNLIVSTLAGYFISNEYSQTSVIKNQIISGNNRTYIFLAKYIVFTLAAIVVTIVIPFAIGAMIVLLAGDGGIFTDQSLLYLGRSYALFFLHFLSFTAIVMIISVITEDSGRTILYTLFLSIAMFVLEQLVTVMPIRTIYEKTMFYHFDLSFNYSLTSAEVITSMLIGIISLIVLLFVGTLIFRRKEIK